MLPSIAIFSLIVVLTRLESATSTPISHLLNYPEPPPPITPPINNVTTGSPPQPGSRDEFELQIHWTRGWRITAVEMAAEVRLSWGYYDHYMSDHDPFAPFTGYTIYGNYKDLNMRSRFFNVLNNAWGIRLTNDQAGELAEQVYEQFMAAWAKDKSSYAEVMWEVRVKGSVPPNNVVARGIIDREPKRPVSH